MGLCRFIIATALAALPSAFKIPIYRRVYGYRIGKGVKIGFSPFVGVKRCVIGDYTRIGSFNLFARVGELVIGEHARVGFLNLVRGGDRVALGPYTTVLRMNVFNAILDPDAVTPLESMLELGRGVFVSTGHWLDFSAGIRVGDHTIIGGRNSSFWTHNRQRGRPITIGRHTYLGSEVRVAPGATIPSHSVVALGSVLSGTFPDARVLLGGNPARVIRALGEEDFFLVIRKTRNDIPNEVVRNLLPEDLQLLFDQIYVETT